MTRTTAATTALVASAAVALLAGPRAIAFPDGAPWETAGDEGCLQCHFDAPPRDPSPALTIAGLPEQVEPGAEYRLSIRLEDRDLITAGFLLTALQDGEQAGSFVSADPRSVTNGAQARSTEAGLHPESPGVTQWELTWLAPEKLSNAVVIELWVNAANDDQSPFGDTVHRRVFELPSK